MMNKHAVARGTVNRLIGDALSTGYPSKGKNPSNHNTVLEKKQKIEKRRVSYAERFEETWLPAKNNSPK